MEAQNVTVNPNARARLHFTEETISKLEEKGFKITHITFTHTLEPGEGEPSFRITYTVRLPDGSHILKDHKGIIYLAYFWKPVEEA